MELSIYLAGGMRTNWREELIETVEAEIGASLHIHWLIPERLPFPDYVTNDLRLIDDSSIVFMYLERDIPSGLGLAAEMGFAKALGRVVIFVNEKYDDRYTDFLRGLSDTYFTYDDEDAYGMALHDGIRWLIAKILDLSRSGSVLWAR